jgi:hypothetical protein
MSNVIPDGYFFNDHVVFGDLCKGGVLSRGFAIDFPDLSASDDQAFIDLESDIRLMLGSLRDEERLQLDFYTSSDFSPALDRFLEDTRINSKVSLCSEVRNELTFRYRDRMGQQTLIQTNSRLYLSSKLPKFISDSGRKIRGFEEVFKVVSQSFEERGRLYDLLLKSYGGSAKPLDQFSHYRELVKFWSPGQAQIWNPKQQDLDWLRTVEDLCRFSDWAPRHPPACGFHMDGRVFGLMVFKTMPRSTWAKTMEVFQHLDTSWAACS